ncbi:MAG: PilZ domain-containing protein [Phycisphaeraceae bacterium]
MRERRQDPRFMASCTVKLRTDQSGLRYLTGRTQNLSVSGALLELEHPAFLLPGQRVEMIVAWEPCTGLVRAEQKIEGTIVRNLRLDEKQYVALRYARRQPLAEAI